MRLEEFIKVAIMIETAFENVEGFLNELPLDEAKEELYVEMERLKERVRGFVEDE